MKCLVLAAGYATRLYPLTENFPKPLLEVKGKTILDWLLDDIDTSKQINEYIIISNHKFYDHFVNWSKTKSYKITIVDDGSISNETRLGAVKDIDYTIKKMHLNDDLLVIAGDNVLDFSLKSFINYAVNKKTSCVMRYYEEVEAKLHKTGILLLDDNDKIINMEEKPANPKSHWCCPPFYFYTKEDASRIELGIASGCGVDAPGSYIAWLSQVTPVHAMEMPGSRYDIGNLESYEYVKNNYGGIVK